MNILSQSLSVKLQSLVKRSSNVPCLVLLGLWSLVNLIVLTETNSKYCEEIDVTWIKAEEVLIMC